MSNDIAINRLLRAPFGHTIVRDTAGNLHVTLYESGKRGRLIHTIVAPTFDEAVTRALDLAYEVTGIPEVQP